MRSSTGAGLLRTTGLNADQMPSGMPISSAITVATTTDVIVCIVSDQRSIDWMSSRPTAEDEREHDCAGRQGARTTRITTIATGVSAVRTSYDRASRRS